MLNKGAGNYASWFSKADEDELSVRAVLKEGAPSTACFLSQQIAEKYLKGVESNQYQIEKLKNEMISRRDDEIAPIGALRRSNKEISHF